MIGPADIDLRVAAPPTPSAATGHTPPPRDLIERRVRDAERDEIVRLLAAHGGSVSRAARAAGRNRTAFYALLKRHGIDPKVSARADA